MSRVTGAVRFLLLSYDAGNVSMIHLGGSYNIQQTQLYAVSRPSCPRGADWKFMDAADISHSL
jgi:hypothetical protein